MNPAPLRSSYDTIVIGGGINGLGIARALARAGNSTLVVERDEACRATSANSLRIIHGGFRYLQTLDFMRAVRSVRDQAETVRECPSGVRPLACLMPLSRTGMKSRYPALAGAMLFRAVRAVGGGILPTPRVLTRQELEQFAPDLAARMPHGALEWHDALMVDIGAVPARLELEIVKRGGMIATQSTVSAVEVRKDSAAVMIERNGVQESIECACVVNAAGPWIGRIPVNGVPPTARYGGSWCVAYNLVLDTPLPTAHAVALSSREGRLLFFVPREGGTAVGTWYRATEDVSARAQPSAIEDAAREVSETGLLGHVDPKNVIATDVGVLPLSPARGTALATPRGRDLILESSRYIEVVSTKYTTFSSLGRHVGDAVRSRILRGGRA